MHFCLLPGQPSDTKNEQQTSLAEATCPGPGRAHKPAPPGKKPCLGASCHPQCLLFSSPFLSTATASTSVPPPRPLTPSLASLPTRQPLFSPLLLQAEGTRRAVALQLVGGSPIIFIQNEVLLKIKGTVDHTAQMGTAQPHQAIWSPCSSTTQRMFSPACTVLRPFPSGITATCASIQRRQSSGLFWPLRVT